MARCDTRPCSVNVIMRGIRPISGFAPCTNEREKLPPEGALSSDPSVLIEGYSSSYPCTIRRVPAADVTNVGLQRHVKND